MILLIDIGNTNTVCAVYNDQKYIKVKRVGKKDNVQAILETFLKYNVTAIAIASVVPMLEDIFIKKINEIFGIEPFVITHNNSNIMLKVDTSIDKNQNIHIHINIKYSD